MVGSNDLVAPSEFYDAVFVPLDFIIDNIKRIDLTVNVKIDKMT